MVTLREGEERDFLVRLREHPSRRNLGEGGVDEDLDEDDGATWMILTRSFLVQLGSMMVQMKGIRGGFQIINLFLWICCNFFIHSKITLFGRQNLGQICHLLTELLGYLPLAKMIHIFKLSLNLTACKIKGFWKYFKFKKYNFWLISFSKFSSMGKNLFPWKGKRFFYNFLFFFVRSPFGSTAF